MIKIIYTIIGIMLGLGTFFVIQTVYADNLNMNVSIPSNFQVSFENETAIISTNMNVEVNGKLVNP